MKNTLKAAATHESTHHTIGINTWSLFAVSMFNAQLWGQISWWFLPITILFGVIAFNNEITRRKQANTFSV